MLRLLLSRNRGPLLRRCCLGLGVALIRRADHRRNNGRRRSRRLGRIKRLCDVRLLGSVRLGRVRLCRIRVDNAFRTLGTLIVELFDDVAYDRASRFAAVLAAFLNQSCDANLGIPLRRIAHKPCVISELRTLFYEIDLAIPDDLRGSGLAAELDAGEAEFSAGSVRPMPRRES